MNRWEKEVQQSLLKDEEAVIRNLEKGYKSALNEINNKIAEYATRIQMDNTDTSAIYQKAYQEQLKAQIEASIRALHSGNYTTISKYLEDSYKNSYIGTFYNMQKQGVPLVIPIDQEDMIRAITLNSKISEGLYKKLGIDTNMMKKRITAEVTRGIASGSSWEQIAKQIGLKSNVTYTNAVRIARTEGHRIQQSSALDAMKKAKSKGADVVKQWDATLDGNTRSTHRALDGQIAELNQKFHSVQGDVEAPGMFGIPSEDCNCRCQLLQRAKWALKEQIDPDTGEVTWTDGEFTKMNGDTGEIVDFSDIKSYDDFKNDFLNQCKVVQQKQMNSNMDLSLLRDELKRIKTKINDLNSQMSSLQIKKYTASRISSVDINAIDTQIANIKAQIDDSINKLTDKGKILIENLNTTFKVSSDNKEFISFIINLDSTTEYKEVMKKTSQRTLKEIVDALGGGDKTSGSCASVGLAYIGQQSGLDVLDFRDGESREFFSSKSNKINMFKSLGVSSIVEDSAKTSLTNAKKVLSYVQDGKEYYLSVGRHAAIVRKTPNGVYQYMELQSSRACGWKDFDSDVRETFKWRFGCSSSSKYYSTAYLTDIDQLKNNDEFRTILGYINTNESNQRKGSCGTIK